MSRIFLFVSQLSSFYYALKKGPLLFFKLYVKTILFRILSQIRFRNSDLRYGSADPDPRQILQIRYSNGKNVLFR
jgi:hypothetical protein